MGSIQSSQQTSRAGYISAVHKLVSAWAIFGGFVLLGVVFMNLASVIGSIFGKPFPGDFELTEMGVAIAAFSFLPYCQAANANVTADIFTQGASPKVVSFLVMLGSIIAFCFALLLLWRMSLGMLDQREYGYTTTILQIPHWLAFLPILVSLFLLALAASVTMLESIVSDPETNPSGGKS